MPATGSSVLMSEKIASIRLWQDGLCFCEPSQGASAHLTTWYFKEDGCTAEVVATAIDKSLRPDTRQQGPMRLFLDLPSALFVPEEIARSTDIGEMLAAAGIELGMDYEAVVTEAVERVCAVVPLPRGVAEVFEKIWGADLHLLSPLHELLTAYRHNGARKRCFVVYPTEGNVYIARYGAPNELLLAEVYPCRTAADTVYYLTEIEADEKRHRKDAAVYVYGADSQRYIPLLQKYFKHTKALSYP